MSLQFDSKLPNVGTTIFTVMSKLSNDYNAINLAQGFPNWDCDPLLQELVNKHISAGKNQYAPMAGVPKLLNRLAEKAKDLYDINIDIKNEIVVTAGATQAIYTAISAFVKPGDEVILIEPAYDSYAPSIRLNGGKVIPYNLQGPSYKVQWEEFNTLITEQTKMIIINTPHNPTGQLLSANDIISLESIIRDKNIIVISDEVYEHLTYDGRTHESVLKYPCLRAKSFAVYSFGKTFHATGWKLGHIIGPKHLMHEFKKVHQFNVFCVNHPIQCAIADYMENKEVYQGLGPMFEKKRDLFLEIISKSKFKPVPCEGTYFQMVDYSEISDLDDIAFAKWITKEVGVAAIPVSVFYTNAPDQKVIRFCFAKTDDVLIEAGKKLFTL